MKLVVILRNDTPLLFCGDCPSYRTVTIFKRSDKCKKQMESEKITVFKCCNKYKKPKEEG